jgi:predicted transcriptional regulator
MIESVSLTIHLPPELYHRLQLQAQGESLSPQEWIQSTLASHLQAETGSEDTPDEVILKDLGISLRQALKGEVEDAEEGLAAILRELADE